MLGYEWGNPGSILLSGEEATQDSDQTRQIFEQYDQNLAGNLYPPPFSSHHQLFHQHHENQTNLQTLFESRAYGLSYPPDPGSISSDPGAQTRGFLAHHPFQSVVPKLEVGSPGDFQARIGLNLGVRTYFSSSENDFVSRLYRRSRPVEAGPANSPKCQAEGCNADLTHAKHYHRRHKVCEFHSKASTVLAAGLTQRFCQQCSRFHVLSEFDQGKRSCRKRLADHNRRRRKSQPQQNHNPSNSPPSGDTRTKSSPESATHSSSSVTVAISPPPMGLDCFRPMIHQPPTSSTSSNCHFAQVGSFRPYDRRMHSSSWEDEEEGQ